MKEKKWYWSKTMWSNIAAGLILIYPPALAFVGPAKLSAILTVVNLVLRSISKDKIV